MISCTEFIPAYNELFKFLHKKYGKDAVVAFWEHIADEFLTNLDDLVKRKGIAGMAEYWTHTLTEEGAEYQMSIGPECFEIYPGLCSWQVCRICFVLSCLQYTYTATHCSRPRLLPTIGRVGAGCIYDILANCTIRV